VQPRRAVLNPNTDSTSNTQPKLSASPWDALQGMRIKK
jgi:hypothetical protein